MAEYNLRTEHDLKEVWVYSRYNFGSEEQGGTVKSGAEQGDKAEGSKGQDNGAKNGTGQNDERESGTKTAAVRAGGYESRAGLWKSLEEAGIHVVSLEEALSKSGTPKETVLFVTDCAEVAEALAEAKFPVLGILLPQNKSASFTGIRYLAEGWESAAPVYLERVYQRYRGIPWRILETARCILRETVEADVDALYRLYAEPSITAFMEDLFADREEELRYTANYRENMYGFYGYGIWSVIEKKTGEIIGRAGFDMREGFAEPELGFVIGVPWQGQGIAEEVCAAILRYGVEELGFAQVRALTEPENIASVALLRKLGFVPDGEYGEKGKKYLQYIKK